jgi:hypothetical protein
VQTTDVLKGYGPNNYSQQATSDLREDFDERDRIQW